MIRTGRGTALSLMCRVPFRHEGRVLACDIAKPRAHLHSTVHNRRISERYIRCASPANRPVCKFAPPPTNSPPNLSNLLSTSCKPDVCNSRRPPEPAESWKLFRRTTALAEFMRGMETRLYSMVVISGASGFAKVTLKTAAPPNIPALTN